MVLDVWWVTIDVRTCKICHTIIEVISTRKVCKNYVFTTVIIGNYWNSCTYFHTKEFRMCTEYRLRAIRSRMRVLVYADRADYTSLVIDCVYCISHCTNTCTTVWFVDTRNYLRGSHFFSRQFRKWAAKCRNVDYASRARLQEVDNVEKWQ